MKFPWPSPLVFAYYKRSKTGGVEGLGTRQVTSAYMYYYYTQDHVQKILYHDNFARESKKQKPEIFVQYGNALAEEHFTYTAHMVSITLIQTFCVHPHTTIVTGALDPVTSHISSLWINILVLQAETLSTFIRENLTPC